MCLLRKITYGEFFEFIREKKFTYNVLSLANTALYIYNLVQISQLKYAGHTCVIANAMLSYKDGNCAFQQGNEYLFS